MALTASPTTSPPEPEQNFQQQIAVADTFASLTKRWATASGDCGVEWAVSKAVSESFYLLGFSQDDNYVQLFSEPKVSSGPRATIFIGPNGSGKSSILGQLVDELVLMSDLLQRKTQPEFKSAARRVSSKSCLVDYQIGGTAYRLRRTDNELTAYADGARIALSKIAFPSKAVAVAHLPVDKFRFAQEVPGEFYTYLGLRQSTNLTTTGSLEFKVLSKFILNQNDSVFSKEISSWLELLELRRIPKLLLRFSDTFPFAVESYDQFISEILATAKRRLGPRRTLEEGAFRKKYAHSVDALWIFINSVKFASDRSSRKMSIDLADGAYSRDISPQTLESAIEFGRHMRLFTQVDLAFERSNGDYVNFRELSSGEQQILGTISRLLSVLRPNAVVAIDEPEVSLHPDWQIRYLPMLLNTLERFPATHLLIATHSHSWFLT